MQALTKTACNFGIYKILQIIARFRTDKRNVSPPPRIFQRRFSCRANATQASHQTSPAGSRAKWCDMHAGASYQQKARAKSPLQSPQPRRLVINKKSAVKIDRTFYLSQQMRHLGHIGRIVSIKQYLYIPVAANLC